MLNPKKSNFLIKELAEELNLPESQISDVVSYYWSNIRKLMEAGEEPKIDVESLGVFYVKVKSLDKEIQKHEDYSKIINPTNLNRYNYYMSVQATLKRLYKIKENLKTQLLDKQQFKSNRNEILEKGKENLED
jgi:nucleoid DNA-binding protein